MAVRSRIFQFPFSSFDLLFGLTIFGFY